MTANVHLENIYIYINSRLDLPGPANHVIRPKTTRLVTSLREELLLLLLLLLLLYIYNNNRSTLPWSLHLLNGSGGMAKMHLELFLAMLFPQNCDVIGYALNPPPILTNEIAFNQLTENII